MNSILSKFKIYTKIYILRLIQHRDVISLDTFPVLVFLSG